MKIIINKGGIYSLLNIPGSSLAKYQADCDEVVTDFIISEIEQGYINDGYEFTYIGGVFTFDLVAIAADALVKQKTADVKEFCIAYRLVEELSEKLYNANQNRQKSGCTPENKALIDMQVANFEARLDVAETNRDVLLANGIANHTDGSDVQKLALVSEFNEALLNNI